jgi:hypothetical protein
VHGASFCKRLTSQFLAEFTLARGRVELFAGRLVLDAESKGLEGKPDFAGQADPLLMCHHLLLVFALAL